MTIEKKLGYLLLPNRFAIVKLDARSEIPGWAQHQKVFSSITRTADELSLVCPEEHVPPEVNASRGWVCLKLEGPFALSETGVLSAFLEPLARNQIAILAIATFDTDYVFIAQDRWPQASHLLRSSGHEQRIADSPVQVKNACPDQKDQTRKAKKTKPRLGPQHDEC